MPLTQQEFDALSIVLHRMVGDDTQPEAVRPVRLDALASLARTAERVLILFERAITRTMQEAGDKGEPEQVTGEQTEAPPPKKRGPKPKQPEGTTPQATAQTAAPTVASAAGNGTPPPTAANPLDDGIPDFLDRRPKSTATDDDVFGEPTPAATPAPQPAKVLTAQEVKDVLKNYMERFGPDGSAKLTALIESVGGVKHFSKLDPSKWPEIVTKAQAAMR